MKIWKYPIETADVQTLEMPKGAQLLSVQTQNGKPQIWALVDDAAPKETRTFATYGTGNPMPDEPGRFVATYQIMGGALVFHVFELANA